MSLLPYLRIWRYFYNLYESSVRFPPKIWNNAFLDRSAVPDFIDPKLSVCFYAASWEKCWLSQPRIFYHYYCNYYFQFKRGITIIDSPGIGEEESMDEMVTQYLTQAFAFVYVIDTSNSGGVKEDRVGIVKKL